MQDNILYFKLFQTSRLPQIFTSKKYWIPLCYVLLRVSFVNVTNQPFAQPYIHEVPSAITNNVDVATHNILYERKENEMAWC